MPKLNIRRFTAGDLQAIKQLHIEALQDIDMYKEGPWNNDLDDIERKYLTNGGEFLVGMIDNGVVSMGALSRISDEIVEVKRMRVHPTVQRKGLGQQMLEALETRAKVLGYRKIELHTTIRQTGAQKLYEKRGYKEVKREIKGWPMEIIFYQKALA